MSISNSDLNSIMDRIKANGPSNAETIYDECFAKLGNHKNSLDLNMDLGLLSSHEFELTVEYIVVYEGLRDDLSWWKRTKRRIQLTKEHT